MAFHIWNLRMRPKSFGVKHFLVALAWTLGSIAAPNKAWGTPIPIGFISWDVTQPGVLGQFDIANETGPNSSFDADFPIVSSLHLGSLALVIQFSDSSTRSFGPSDLILNPFDGSSYESPSIALGGFSPKPLSASLSGIFLTTTLTLYDGSFVEIQPAFTAQISAGGAALADGDLGLILATVQTPQPIPPAQVTPEPSSWALFGSALAIIFAVRFSAQGRFLNRS